MKLTTPLLLLALSAACLVSGRLRRPRAVWQFGTMIQCVQPDVTAWKYNDYGCWCGVGGQGEPVDKLDTCCKVHDKCYEASRKNLGCKSLQDHPYTVEYEYTCSNQVVTCSASNNKCQAAACDCDRVAAHCFAENEYNEENKHLDPNEHCWDDSQRAACDN